MRVNENWVCMKIGLILKREVSVKLATSEETSDAGTTGVSRSPERKGVQGVKRVTATKIGI